MFPPGNETLIVINFLSSRLTRYARFREQRQTTPSGKPPHPIIGPKIGAPSIDCVDGDQRHGRHNRISHPTRIRITGDVEQGHLPIRRTA
jgi:hypothetical protein